LFSINDLRRKKMKRFLERSILTLIILSLAIGMVACTTDKARESTDLASTVEATPSADAVVTELPEISEQTDTELDLEENNWVPETRDALNRLMADYGIRSTDYNEMNKPYVVFDFDNTTSFFDVEEALLIYQLENLRFKIGPDQMYHVLITEVPSEDFDEDYNNAAGETLNVEIVARDCQTAYTWLCENYEGLGHGGEMKLEEIKQTKQFTEFITKVRYLYYAIGDTFDAAVSYPWVTYLFTGMTSEEVRELATESHDYWFAINKWEKIIWTSPEEYESEAGVVSVSYKTSIAIPPESVDLYNKLMTNGFDVYICSASFIDVIEALAYNPKYSLNVEEGNVYAMRLKTNEEGRYINEFDDNYFQTQGEGKKQTIDKFIAPKYDGRGPIFVAGDSQGDYNMMTEYSDMVLGLILNRVRTDDFAAISKEAADSFGDEDAKYVLQGRDENKGVYIPTQESVLMGSDTPQLLSVD